MFRQSLQKKGRASCPCKDFLSQGRERKMALEEDLAQYAHNKAGERFAAFEEEAM